MQTENHGSTWGRRCKPKGDVLGEEGALSSGDEYSVDRVGAARTASDSDVHSQRILEQQRRWVAKFHQARVPEGRDLQRWRRETMKMRNTREDSRAIDRHWKQICQNSEEFKEWGVDSSQDGRTRLTTKRTSENVAGELGPKNPGMLKILFLKSVHFD